MKTKYTYEDVSTYELELLEKSLSIPTDCFMCFGKYFPKLHELNLVGDDNRPTKLAKAFAARMRKAH